MTYAVNNVMRIYIGPCTPPCPPCKTREEYWNSSEFSFSHTCTDEYDCIEVMKAYAV
jgi:hypothetical protein